MDGLGSVYFAVLRAPCLKLSMSHRAHRITFYYVSSGLDLLVITSGLMKQVVGLPAPQISSSSAAPASSGQTQAVMLLATLCRPHTLHEAKQKGKITVFFYLLRTLFY
jgi:hypothetical protein